MKDVCKYPEYVNFEFGSVGKATSTKDNPNTAAHFHFWIADGVDTVELGNIVAAELPSRFRRGR